MRNLRAFAQDRQHAVELGSIYERIEKGKSVTTAATVVHCPLSGAADPVHIVQSVSIPVVGQPDPFQTKHQFAFDGARWVALLEKQSYLGHLIPQARATITRDLPGEVFNLQRASGLAFLTMTLRSLKTQRPLLAALTDDPPLDIFDVTEFTDGQGRRLIQLVTRDPMPEKIVLDPAQRMVLVSHHIGYTLGRDPTPWSEDITVAGCTEINGLFAAPQHVTVVTRRAEEISAREEIEINTCHMIPLDELKAQADLHLPPGCEVKDTMALTEYQLPR